MPGRERGPLLGTVVDGPDVYEICEGERHPVSVWRGDVHDPVGYVTVDELRLACDGQIPNIGMAGQHIARLSGRHIQLRIVVGELVRAPAPDSIIQLGGTR